MKTINVHDSAILALLAQAPTMSEKERRRLLGTLSESPAKEIGQAIIDPTFSGTDDVMKSATAYKAWAQTLRKPRGNHLSDEKRREISSMGGKAVSQNREHMKVIGKKGGEKVAENREHMSQIGKKGGKAIADQKKRSADNKK